MRLKSNTYLLLLVFMLFSCGEELIERPIDSQNLDLIVVEGIFTNENINHLVKLTRPHLQQNETPEPISGAVVVITDGEDQCLLTESPPGSGLYYTKQVRAVSGKGYTLIISYNGKEYIGSDGAQPVGPLRPIKFINADTTSTSLFMLRFEESGANPNYINHDLNWEDSGNCVPNIAICKAKVVFYDLKVIGLQELGKPTPEDFIFPSGTVVIRKKYSTSLAYRNFLQSVLSETDWRGGFFDIERANAASNLSEGAIGFFAVSTVVSDTTVVQ